jgi:aryl-alcohol dehydrogenase-like predicted oxidoreductase
VGHARDNFTPVEEVMRALHDLVRTGKALYVGVSDWPAWEIAQANALAELRGWTAFAGSQLRYNLLDRTPERDCCRRPGAFDLAVPVWAPPAAGKLTGRYRRGETGWPDTTGGDAGPREEAVISAVLEVAEQGGWSPAQVAPAWLPARPGNVVPIVAATKESQPADNLASVDVRLDADALARLDEVSAVPLGFPHDFVREPAVTRNIYGDRWTAVDDRRSTHRRTAHEVL